MYPSFNKILCLTACILTLLITTGPGNAQKLSFNNWTAEAGLSQNTVYAISEDQYGFIWIGTRNGLNRFDGRSFKTLHPPLKGKSITGENDVTALLANSNHLWVGISDGLMMYDLVTNRFSPIAIEDTVYKFLTFALFRDHSANIWLCTNRGIFRTKERGSLVFTKFGKYDSTALPDKIIRTICEEKNGTLWVGSTKGLTRIRRGKTGWEYKTFKSDDDDPSSISSDLITAVATDTNDNIWIGTRSKGLCLFNKTTESFVRISKDSPGFPLINDHIRVIKCDKNGVLWIGTQEGISRLNWKQKTLENYHNDPADKHSLSQNSVHSIFIDHNNYVWVGTFFGGLNLINPFPSDFKVWQNTGTASGLSNNVVSSVAEDNYGNLWIGTEGGGLNYYNRQSGTFSYFNHSAEGLGSNLIKTIFKDTDQNIWIGTHAGGLNLYQNGQFRRYFFTPENPYFLTSEISTIAEDENRHLWIGFQGGIQGVRIYQRSGTDLKDISNEYEKELLQRRNIKRIFPDSRQNIWIATSDGLFVVRKGKKTVERIVSDMLNTSFKITHITSIQEDIKGNIWFGIAGGGLRKYNPVTQKIYSYSFHNQGEEKDVFGILEDRKGYIWLSTINGLIRLNPESGAFQTYTQSDGLPSNTFNYNAYFKDAGGIFYFGGYNGLISFDPSFFSINNKSGSIQFTHLKTLNQQEIVNINTSRTLELDHDQNVFTIEFALLNFIKPEKNKYAYQLRGFDRQWTETEKPSVTYMNLKPGTYTLLVKGANNDGKWSREKAMSIVVHPPFWATWWAYLIYSLLFCTILFLIVRFFYLKERIAQEEALHQHKLNFFTNITHEIRTHLTLIMAPVDKMISDRAQDSYLQQQFEHIRKNSDNLLRLSEELMDFRRVETENLNLEIAEHGIVEFLKEIYEHFRELSLARNMRISFTHEMQEFPLYFDREQMEKVFFNLISNAFKFTPDGGKIQVHIAELKDYIKVSVTDNGKGIAPEFKDKLFNNFFQVNDSGSQNKGYGIGLALSHKIAALHGAKIDVDSLLPENSSRDAKTTFAVLLLKGRDHFKQEINEAKPRVVIVEEKKRASADAIKEACMEDNPLESYMDSKMTTILVVDDNPDIRNMISEMLSDKHEVIILEDARQGWTYATDHIPDLIISDVMMPHEDGLSFCFRLKSDTRTCHIPVILLTAKTAQQDHIAGLDKGADVYLTKPFNRKILELTARNLLSTKERVRESVKQQIQEGAVQSVFEKNKESHNELDSIFLKDIMDIIDKYLDDPAFNVTVMSQQIGMSVPVLYKKMKAVTSLSVNDFVKSVKLQKAAELLQQNNLAVYEVCYAVGYQDRKHFSTEFKKKFGKSPKQYALSFSGNSTND